MADKQKTEKVYSSKNVYSPLRNNIKKVIQNGQKILKTKIFQALKKYQSLQEKNTHMCEYKIYLT